MADSDSDLPSAATITNKLRDIVIAIHKTGKAEDLTLKRVRTRAEQELGLDEGFFKKSADWKQQSEDNITEFVDKYCSEEIAPKESPKKAAPKPRPKPKPAEKKTKPAAEGARGVKRKNAVPVKKPKKRRKASSDEESKAELSEPAAELSDADSEPPKKPMQRGKKVVADDSDEEEVTKPVKKARAIESDGSDAEPATPAKKPAPKDDVSESELSELIDDSPPRKPKQKKALAAKKEKAPAKPKAAPKLKASDDPDEAEIKRLQGWLVKCGIRKVWSRDPELSKCDTAKEKIRLLRDMLKDVGLDGKYSNEKATSIKEKREFEKDLAAIQEGELHWGKTTGVTSTGRPSRRAAAARPPPQQKIVLSDESDEDEDSGKKDDDSGDNDDDDDVKGVSDENSEGDDSGGDDSGSE